MNDDPVVAAEERDRWRLDRPSPPPFPPKASLPPPDWLLVTGAPRSGTSLLRALLTAHPNVGLLQEYGLTALVHRIDALVARPPADSEDWASPGDPGDTRFNAVRAFYRDRPEMSPIKRGGVDPGPEQFEPVASALFRSLFPGRDLRIVGDKMPIAADRDDLPLLFDRLPGFRVIAIVRNPADTIRSSLIRREATRRGRDTWPIRTVEEAMAQWVAAWRAVQSMQALYGPIVRVIKFEDLCERPRDVVDQLFAWLGLPDHTTSLPISSLPPELALHSTEEQAAVEAYLGHVVRAWPHDDADALLTKFVAFEPLLTFGEPIRLSEAEAESYVRSGFSFREPWGRWTDGPLAFLSIRHGLSRGLLAVDISVLQAFAPEGQLCNVVIRSGWTEPKLFQLPPGPSRIAFLAEAGESEEPGNLVVEIAVLRPKHRHEAPADDRALGVLVDAVTITRVPVGSDASSAPARPQRPWR